MENSDNQFSLNTDNNKENTDNEWLKHLTQTNFPLPQPVHAGRRVPKSLLVSNKQRRGIGYGK